MFATVLCDSGHLRHVAPILCSLSDPEDDRPHFRIQPMNDQDDSRNDETLAPPTDREAPTNPANETTRRDATPPPAIDPPTADSMFLDAVQKITRAARIIEDGEAEARATEARRRADHDALLAAIQKADDNNQRSYELLHNELRHLKDSDRHQNSRLAEGDERFAAIEKSIANLKDELLALVTRASEDAARRIAGLENELAELRTNAARPSPPATA